MCAAWRAITQEAGTPGPWEVVVFKDRSANAFALPGGKIGVNTGLLEVAENQDQLAAVLGHEVAHVLANHANERLSQELGVQVGLGALGSVAGNPNSVSQQSIMKVLGLGAQLGILLPFSRVHETEADVIGLDLMARAGFDPRQSLALWRNMARAGGSQPPEFLSTHPSYGSRTQELEKNMGKAWQTYEAARARGKYPRCN
jgi:predicted Zn-dependent protease